VRIHEGHRAEAEVAKYLVAEGARVLATNLRLQYLEIDIVARVASTLLVVEVRTRGVGAWTRALGSIDWRKRQRIRRAGQRLWQRRYRYDSSIARLRFDAAAVTFHPSGPVVEYVAAAF
jgi:putative endonuclease